MTKYRNHNVIDVLQSQQYVEHVSAMTVEALYEKGEIAEERRVSGSKDAAMLRRLAKNG
jgi:hypothetical protein